VTDTACFGGLSLSIIKIFDKRALHGVIICKHLSFIIIPLLEGFATCISHFFVCVVTFLENRKFSQYGLFKTFPFICQENNTPFLLTPNYKKDKTGKGFVLSLYYIWIGLSLIPCAVSCSISESVGCG